MSLSVARQYKNKVKRNQKSMSEGEQRQTLIHCLHCLCSFYLVHSKVFKWRRDTHQVLHCKKVFVNVAQLREYLLYHTNVCHPHPPPYTHPYTPIQTHAHIGNKQTNKSLVAIHSPCNWIYLTLNLCLIQRRGIACFTQYFVQVSSAYFSNATLCSYII